MRYGTLTKIQECKLEIERLDKSRDNYNEIKLSLEKRLNRQILSEQYRTELFAIKESDPERYLKADKITENYIMALMKGFKSYD